MSKTVLIVDDSDSMRQVVVTALRGAGYQVLEASDGQEGLKQLQSQRVHLVVCDVNMPNMDGLTMVSEVKQQPSHKFTPVIMLTTESQEAMKEKGKEIGVKAWMVKPFKPEKMLDAVSKLIG